MFNANNLVLHDAEVLQEVREFPIEFWLGVLAVVLVTYFFHSFAVWRLMNRVGVKGFFLAFLPFMRFFAYNRLGKEVGDQRLSYFTGCYPWSILWVFS